MADKVLIAEDDRGVRESLERALRFEGYDVRAVRDGSEALEEIDQDRPDVIVCDISMPHVNGLDVCRMVRSRGDRLPILMLTARHEIADRVAGLDAGADDYLVKPFALDELLARIRSLIQRAAPDEDASVVVGDLALDPQSRQVRRGCVDIDLTKTEFELLELLMRNAGIVLERDMIYRRIWGYEVETDSKSLDVYIGYLRRKTEVQQADRMIHTVRGVGYTLRSA